MPERFWPVPAGRKPEPQPVPAVGSVLSGPVQAEAKYDRNNRLIRPEITTATFVLGYKGYVQLALRSGQYADLDVMEIKEGEYLAKIR